jgi:CRP/FNR family transcriptional regulator, cyclic AMP receptor protein
MGAPAQLTRRSIVPPRPYDGMHTEANGQQNHRVHSFGGCSPQFDTERFLASESDAVIMKFRKAECVFAQGDPADSIFYVRHGSIKQMVVSNRGKEATIGVLGNGEFCGEGCLIDEPVRSLSAMTMTSCAVLRIPKRSFAKLLRENQEFSAFFTKILVTRSIQFQKDLIDQRFHPSEYRLARLLLSLSDRPSPSFYQRTLPKISQETLASMVGTTRSRISFFLNKFKKAGLIEYSGGIRINPGLEELLDNR